MEKHHRAETEIPISGEEGMPGACRADGGKWLQEEVPSALGLEVQFQKECKKDFRQFSILEGGKDLIGLAFSL